ncbi:MAG: nitroreductase/quinone reductase family protein [Chloroflexota bacterium]|nr:nitroreductase/quinone reductase family protein [Chloroflexota bacterium]
MATTRLSGPTIHEVADGVHVVTLGRGTASSNVYMIRYGASWTLVDAGWPGADRRIEAAAAAVFGQGSKPAAMLLTHIHPDHSGATRQLVEHWEQPAYVHPDELPMAAGHVSEYANPLDRWVVPLIGRLPARTRARIAAGADLTELVRAFDPDTGVPGLPEWIAIPTPGHTPGHISLFRSSDAVLLTGDAVVTVDLDSPLGILTGRQGLFGPPRVSTWSRDMAQRSIGVLAALEPRVVAPGHGPIRADRAAEALHDLAAGRRAPARWRQGLFAPVDYSAGTRYRPPPPLYRRVQGRLGPLLVGHGIGPRDVVVLEVPGRRSGLVRRTTLVKAWLDGDAYLVALAGESEWVRNVRAAGGHVRIGRRRRDAVRLVELPPSRRPPILRAYLTRWHRKPDSRAMHREAAMFFGVTGNPSDQELAEVSTRYPVFRIDRKHDRDASGVG